MGKWDDQATITLPSMRSWVWYPPKEIFPNNWRVCGGGEYHVPKELRGCSKRPRYPCCKKEILNRSRSYWILTSSLKSMTSEICYLHEKEFLYPLAISSSLLSRWNFNLSKSHSTSSHLQEKQLVLTEG